MAVKKQGTAQLINIEDVLYFKGADMYVEIYLHNGKKELHDKSLEKLNQLLPKSFIRIHKSYLLKLSVIKKLIVQSGSKYSVELNNGEMLSVGRTRYKALRALLN